MPVKIGQIVWPGPVGIGAGLIKSATVFVEYAKRADSIEVGSVTRHLCTGNQGKTIWRYMTEKGLRHNAGMPNPGAEGLAAHLVPVQNIIGVPWGLNVAVTPGIAQDEAAAEDVAVTVKISLEKGLRPKWLTFNPSSPDTADPLDKLMAVTRVRLCLEKIHQVVSNYQIPIWLKLGVRQNIEDILALVNLKSLYETLVFTNAMADEQGLPGGWCGEPVRAHMLATVARIHELKPDLPMVAVGGIQTGKQVAQAIEAGAAAIQVVSAILFDGLEAPSRIKEEYQKLATSH